MVQFKVSRMLLDQMFKLDAVEARITEATVGKDVVTFEVDVRAAPVETVEMCPVYRRSGPGVWSDVVMQSVDWVGPDGERTSQQIG